MFPSVFFLLFVSSYIYEARPGSAEFLFVCHYNIIHFFDLHFRYFSQAEGTCFFHFFDVVRLCICTAWCDVVFFFFVKHFHFQLQFSVATDRLILCRSMSLFLWVSVCALSSSLLSFRHYQTKAYFKTFWKRYISLIPFTPVCLVFCLYCLFLFSVHVTK